MPTEFFEDIPVTSTSTTGLPLRELESWLFFDENGYLKQQPQREGPKGVHLAIKVTDFSKRGSPTKRRTVNTSTVSKTTTVV